MRFVLLVFEQQLNRPLLRSPDTLSEFLEQMLRPIVQNGMNRIEAQAVKVKFLDPIEGIVNDKFPYLLGLAAVVIDGSTPGRLMAIGKESGRVKRQVVP